MNRAELLEALEVERYASPPTRPANTADGPTARWNAHQRVVNEIRRLYQVEKFTTDAIAKRMRLPWHAVVGVVEGWTA